jgi:S1-C subfamily serine protease
MQQEAMHAALCVLLLGALPFGTPVWGQQPTSRSPSQRERPSKAQSGFDIQEAAKRVASVVVQDEAGNSAGQGSGFFVDSQGTLITNYHVIEKASGAIVKTSDGAYYVVEGVLAEDAKHDLAVLKVAGRNFAFLPLGDSTKLSVGDRVIAVGSPLGLESTVSDGIVSSLREDGESKVIQTTAPMSPGSSGGVLLNSRGQVIGVTAFGVIAGQNLNFAIPSNYIRPLLAASSVRPFHPSPSEPQVAKEVEAPKPKAPEPLPRQWINVKDGTQISLRREENLVYAEGGFQGDGQYIRSVTFTCNGKKVESHYSQTCPAGKSWVATAYGGYCSNEKGPSNLPDEWVGQCFYRIEMGYLVSRQTCFVNLALRITSVSPRRIEGTLQKLAPGFRDPCPTADRGETTPLTLIPKE